MAATTTRQRSIFARILAEYTQQIFGRLGYRLVSSKFLPLISAQQEMGNIETCYQGALTDADRVLVFLREPDNPAALIARGDAYYFLGRFEHALVRRVGIMEDHIYHLMFDV